MTPNLGSWFQQEAHDASDDRLFIKGLLAQHGVGAAGDLLCSPGGLMTTNVAAGHVFIPGTTLGTQGSYHGYNDAVYNVAHDPADASPRLDTVVAKVDDNEVDFGGFNRWRIYVVKGTTGAYPNPAALPASAIPLAYVTVNNGVTTLLTGHYADARPRAAGRSGVVICTSTTRPAAYEGLHIYETDTDKTARYNGSTWHYLLDRVSLTAPIDHDSLVYDGTVWRNEPRGFSRYDTVVSNSGNITDTAAQVAGLVVPGFPFKLGRKYLIVLEVSLQLTTATGYAFMQIRRDGTLMKEAQFGELASLTQVCCTMRCWYEPGSTADRDIQFWLKSASSGYNVHTVADANTPGSLEVIDMGRV